MESGRGTIAEDARVNSGFSQSFLLPAGARALQFTIVSAQFDLAAGMPSDAFEVALLESTSGVSLFDVSGLTLTDALFNLQADGQLFTAAGVTTSGDFESGGTATPIVITIDLTGVAAQSATLYFELLGFGATGSR